MCSFCAGIVGTVSMPLSYAELTHSSNTISPFVSSMKGTPSTRNRYGWLHFYTAYTGETFLNKIEEWIAVTSHLAVIFVATVIDLQCTGTENLPPLILGLQFCNANWKKHSAKWLYMRSYWGEFRRQEESGRDTKLPEKYWDEYLLHQHRKTFSEETPQCCGLIKLYRTKVMRFSASSNVDFKVHFWVCFNRKTHTYYHHLYTCLCLYQWSRRTAN